MGVQFDRLRYWNSSNSIYCHSFLVLLYQHLPVTVLKHFTRCCFWTFSIQVAIAATVYGIETFLLLLIQLNNRLLQQYLPFTVLKLFIIIATTNFTFVATVPTVYGIETNHSLLKVCDNSLGCNSTYHLRYAQKGAKQQRCKATMRSTHLKCLNEVKVKRR